MASSRSTTVAPEPPASEPLPEAVPADVAALEELLSRPTPAVVDMMRRLKGDLLVLGVSGKMGPTLARMARRATEEAGVKRRVIGVARFSEAGQQEALEAAGVETLRADLLDEQRLAELPDAPNIVYMAGMKFGATGNESLTWAMNTYLPALVCRRFAGSRIAAFSTGNIYGLVPVVNGGAVEGDPVRPEGEYAMSCLGRERMFEHFSRTSETPVSILRLNYACELRYGVLVDLAKAIAAGKPINRAMSAVNVIWQGDANAHSLLALDRAGSPAVPVNIAGPEILGVERVVHWLGERMGMEPILEGEPAQDVLLNNAQRTHALFGYPQMPIRRLIEWVGDWVKRGGESLGKPTKFEVRDGRF